jgi:hypothetical protein
MAIARSVLAFVTASAFGVFGSARTSVGPCDGVAVSTPVVEHGLPVVNAMPRFWSFVDSARGMNRDRERALFRRLVVCPDSAVYAGLTGGPTDRELDDYLDHYRADTTSMRLIDSWVSRNFSQERARFDTILPDAKWDGVRVYFLPLLYSAAGGGRSPDGTQVLAFGINTLARAHFERWNAAVLFDHELFHQYFARIQALPGVPRLGQVPLYRSVWSEGLASYASLQMNPASSLADMNMYADSGKQAFAQLPELAHQIRDRLDSTSVRIHNDYVSGRPGAGLVRFGGYYVGYVIAQRLGHHLSLPELARLRDPQLRQAIDSLLRVIETEPPRKVP